MDAATFATGISVQPPGERSRREPFFPFARPPPSSSASVHGSPASRASLSPEIQQQTLAVIETDGTSDADKDDEDETYGALQEVAYQYACERARAAVDAVIAGANVNCYRQVLGFFERYRSQPTPASPTLSRSSQSAPLVSFPEFHAFPAAGIVSGADATSSDVWIAPLCQVLQRSFPLMLVLPPEVPTARRLVEWVAEQLDAIKSERAREELWLVKEIDDFDLFSADAAQADARVGAMSLTAPDERLTRRKRKELEEQWRRRQPGRQARQVARQSKGRDAGYSSGSAFEDDPSAGSSDYSSDDNTPGRKRPAKRLRVDTASRSTRSKPTTGQASHPYAKWTVEQLLSRIWSEVNTLMTGSDPCETWMTVLRDMVLAPLNEMIEINVVAEGRTPVEANGSGESAADGIGVASAPPSTATSQSIQKAVTGCQSAIQWLMGRIVASRSVIAAGTSASLSGSSPSSLSHLSASTSSTSTSVKMRSTEFALAQLLHEVLRLSLDFTASTIEKIKVVATSTASPAMPADQAEQLDRSGVAALASLLPELESWRSTLNGWVKKHETQYQLHHYQGPSDDPPKPFLLLCIEELEAFAPQVLDDFLEIWTHFRQIQQSFQQETVSASLPFFRPPPSLTGFMSMGLIVGVASGASPALRRLPVAVVSRLDTQFFQLDDSLKCFDDILESLVVDQKLPLALSGAALRLLAERHRTTQSIAVFLHALRYLLFSHFKHVPWSMLSHFAFTKHCARPLDALGAIASLSPAVAAWLVRKRRKQELPTGRSRSSNDLVTAYLDLFPVSGARVAELHVILTRSRGNSKKQTTVGADWKRSVARELRRLSRRRARWAAGWQCFRSACSWLDVPLTGDALLTHLALALDGKLATGEVIHKLVQQLERASAIQLQPMVDHWRALVEGVLTSDTIGDADSDELWVKQVAETLRELVMLCEYSVETQDRAETKRMLVHVHREIRDVFIDRLVVDFVQSSASTSVSRSMKWSLGDLVTLRLEQSVVDNLHFSYHDKLKELLMATALEEEYEGVSAGEGGGVRTPSWLEDVSVAFLYYQENPGVYLSLRDWFDAFADAVGEEEGLDELKKTKEEKKKAQVEVKARFLRAFCTLRHWGFVKSEATSDRDTIEKLVFI